MPVVAAETGFRFTGIPLNVAGGGWDEPGEVPLAFQRVGREVGRIPHQDSSHRTMDNFTRQAKMKIFH